MQFSNSPSGSAFVKNQNHRVFGGGVHVQGASYCSPQGICDTGPIQRHHARISSGSCAREKWRAPRSHEIPGNDSAAQQGETFDLSERGIGFKAQHSLSVGESVEISFTLPTELTWRAMEDVKCNMVQVDREADMSGRIESAPTLSASSYFARRGPTVKVTFAAVVLSN
jgi:hypothetical protein